MLIFEVIFADRESIIVFGDSVAQIRFFYPDAVEINRVEIV